MSKTILIMAMASTLLTGCAGNSLRSAVAKTQATDEGVRDAAIATFKCGKADGEKALDAPIIGIAVDTTLGALSKTLVRAQEARTASWTASGSTDKLHTCEKKGELTIKRAGYKNGTMMSNPIFDLTANIDFQSKKGENLVFTITPLNLIYSDTSARSRGKGFKDVTLAITFTPIGLISDASKKTEPTTTLINLGRLEIKKKYSNFNPKDSIIKTAISVPEARAYNISVVVTESEDPSVLLEAFGEAFEGNKSDLGTALEDAIGRAVGS